jgi:hypothetical protein
MTRIAYFDCLAGASGDMILGALLDAGAPEADLRRELQALHLPGFQIHSRIILKNGLKAVKVDVLIDDETTERTLPQILNILADSTLPEEVRTQAAAICRRLGEVEAGIHGQPLESVHLHELGGLDTIVDIVGTLIGLRLLHIDKVFASPLPLGGGFTRSAHGPLPLPAPAVLALLEGVPVRGSTLEFELLTPTGAVLLTSLASGFGPIPGMKLLKTGYGAGGRDLPIPNVLRLLIGEQDDSPAATLESLALLETNLDDLNPQAYGLLMERLFQAGALDVFLQSIQMKKNRPGTLVAVLCPPQIADSLSAILFRETTTLGVRRQLVERLSLQREIRVVETPYGRVRVKFAALGQGQVKFMPEYEDCRELATRHAIPLRQVSLAAEIAAQKLAPRIFDPGLSAGHAPSSGEDLDSPPPGE